MSNEKSLAIVPKTFTDVQSMAEVLSKSALMPDALRGKANDVVVQILAGQELGLPPMASIRGMHVIQGRPTIGADTMMGLVLGSGLAEYFAQIESTPTSVTFETKRKGSPVPQRVTWTMEDAKRAGLNTKETWRLYPRQMLASRAKAELARSAYPDVLASVYDPDELPSTAPAPAPIAHRDLKPDNSNADAIDAEIVSETPAMTEAEAFAKIAGITDLSELKVLSATFAALPADIRARLRVAYDARKAELTAPVAAETAA